MQKMQWKRALLFAVIVLPGIWLLAAGFGRDPHEVPSMLVGKPAPHFALVDLVGRSYKMDALKGRPLLLNFWATWCIPCQAEHGLLSQVARQHAQDLTVLGVLYQDDLDSVRRYLSKSPSSYDHLVDDNSHVAIDFGVAGVPETFFIDANGIIVHKHAGALSPQVLDTWLPRILPAASAGAPGP